MKSKKGISLIVLVITIIVMIILAAAVVVSLNNTGIIGKANTAVEATNKKQIEDLASLAWADAFMDGARTQAELKSAVDEALEDIDLSKYKVVVTEKGVTVKERGNIVLSLDKTSVTQVISTGTTEEITLTATATGIDETLTWTTSNEAVATVVGNGTTATVTLLGEGTATITVTGDDETATCNITVSEEIIKSQQFTFAYNDAEGLYKATVSGMSDLEEGKTYVVEWDGVKYTCTATSFEYTRAEGITTGVGSATRYRSIGNATIQTLIWQTPMTTSEPNTGEPFIICKETLLTNSTATTHTVRVYEKAN